MRYGLITIDIQNVNLGNRLIEYSIKTLLNLPKPTVIVSMFKIPSPKEICLLNSCDFVLLPGSTILAKAKGNSDALCVLSQIKVPKFCIAASGWKPKFPYYIDIMKQITPPIGCRDPDTLAVCNRLKIPAILTGCPTAYFPTLNKKPKVLYTIIGFARDNIDWQIALLEKIKGKKVAAVQENRFAAPIVRRLKVDMFTYSDPEDVLRHYAETSAVITGRLHGILPAISQDKPVMFFGHANDSRFTLLEYLGLVINNMNKEHSITYQHCSVYKDKRDELKENFLSWGKLTGVYK